MEENIEKNIQPENEKPDKLQNPSEVSNNEISELNIKNDADKDTTLEMKKETIKEEKLATSNIKNEANSLNKNGTIPKKDIPIEKKPFDEFVNINLIPSIKNEFNQRGLEVEEINLKYTLRPVAGDKCWVIYCAVKNTCNFWLSFDKEDITSSKSISISKTNQNASVIESFLIDEKRITLKLIISRIFQRLNGQKLIGIN